MSDGNQCDLMCGSSSGRSTQTSCACSVGGISNFTELYCKCNKPAKLQQSWTDDNPGRRFYGCGCFKRGSRGCNFFRWYDMERVNGWPKAVLIETRNQIREKNGEIRELSRIISQLEKENNKLLSQGRHDTEFMIEDGVANVRKELKEVESENERLKRKLNKKMRMVDELKDSNGILRALILFLWVLLFVVVFVSYYIIKKP